MVDFQKFMVAGILIGLAGLSFLMFAYQFASDNNSNELLQSDVLNLSSFNRSLSGLQTTSEAEYNATSNEPLSKGFGTIILFSIRTAGNVFAGVVSVIFNNVFALMQKYLGIASIVIGSFVGIILIIIIFSLWTKYRSGG